LDNILSERFEQSVLPNGIQVVTEAMPHAHSVALGIWVRSGPRYERESQEGISHFVEHMLFKGTQNRTARQINESLYPVGGHLNAFTDREFTCYTALVLREDLSLAVEVLSDMLLNSVFAAEELEREKNVIIEEIRAIEDTPEDLVHDIFVDTIWPDHALGRPVIGRIETVASFTRDAVLQYVHSHYTADGILVAAAGNLDHDYLLKELERSLGSMGGVGVLTNPSHPRAHPNTTLVYRKTEQAHLCLGMSSFQQEDADNYPMVILDTVLGGGPHSRLFDEIRENQGLAYNVGSGVMAYAEGGLFTIYASMSPRNLNKVIRIIREQLNRVTQEGLTEDEIELARRHIRASWLLAHEGTGSRMGRIANSQLYFHRMISFEEVIRKLEAVTKDDVLRVAQKVFRRESSALAVIGPIQPTSKQAQSLRAA